MLWTIYRNIDHLNSFFCYVSNVFWQNKTQSVKERHKQGKLCVRETIVNADRMLFTRVGGEQPLRHNERMRGGHTQGKKKKESRSSSYHILSRKIYITKRLDIYPPYTTQWWYFLFLFFMWLLRVNRSLNRRPILLLFLFFSLSSIQLYRTGCTQPRERESSVKSSLGYL